jgi:hypothetical protein
VDLAWGAIDGLRLLGAKPYIVAPVASDALTLLRWWDRVESGEVSLWKQKRQHDGGQDAPGKEPERKPHPLVIHGRPDIIGYTVAGTAFKWVSAHNWVDLSLADSYRFLLGPAEKPLVSFMEEWEFCKNYVELMKVRFGERLSVWMEYRGDFSRVLIPPLSIQPVIENAFRHGVQKIPGNAIVQIFAECGGSSVRIEVKDNGPGLPSDFESRSIDNIRSRLRFHFPGADLEVSNLGESGVSSRITLTGAA